MGAPQTLPATFDKWDAAPSAPPATLPADFSGWDVGHGVSGSWEESPKPTKVGQMPRAGEVWQGVSEPLVPEGRAEREGHAYAESPPTIAELKFNAKHPTVGPLVAGAKRGVAGTYADTAETVRGFTSPLAIGTLGLGKLAEGAGAGAKVARVASKVAGAGFTAQGAAQGASGAYDIAKHGATPENLRKTLSGTGQAVLGSTATGGKGTQAALTERLPLRMINQLIKPSVADVKFGKNPGMAILDEKIVGNSLPEIGDKVYDKLQEVGKQIDATLKAPQSASKSIDLQPSLKPIDDAMAKATQAGNRGLYSRLVQLKQQLTMNWAQQTTKAGIQTIKPSGPRTLTTNPYDAVVFKRMVGDSVKWTGNDPFEDTLNGVKGQIYGNIKNQINQAVPEVAPLNERYSNLVGAGKAIERRIPVAERNAQWSLSDIALGASGHIPLAITRKVLSLPAVKTRVAQTLHSLAPQ